MLRGMGALRTNLALQPRLLQHSACALAAYALMTAGLTVAGTRSAWAEFEIQESSVEKGEVEVEYRGAYHWGLPKTDKGGSGVLDDEIDDTEGEVRGDRDEEVPLRQSHDLEFEMGITDRWMVSTTIGTTVPAGFNWQLDAVEVETQYELIERHGNGLGLAFAVSYGWAAQPETANEVQFGPIMEFGLGKFLLTTNTYISRQTGDFAETDGLGFEYGWRGEYDFSKHWGVGVEMFGEIEDLSNAGSFNDQQHSIGPTLFWKPITSDDDDEAGDVGEVDANGDDDNGKQPKPAGMEFSMNVGVQLGLTDATSDGALKFQGTLGF
jgi:hypothetical protein